MSRFLVARMQNGPQQFRESHGLTHHTMVQLVAIVHFTIIVRPITNFHPSPSNAVLDNIVLFFYLSYTH